MINKFQVNIMVFFTHIEYGKVDKKLNQIAVISVKKTVNAIKYCKDTVKNIKGEDKVVKKSAKTIMSIDFQS